MRTGTFVAALTAAGLVGGAAGGLLVRASGGAPEGPTRGGAPAAEPEGDEAFRREVASLRARLDEMRASVDTSARETARLRGTVEEQGRAVAATRERVEGMEAPPGVRSPDHGAIPIAADGEGTIVRLEQATERLRKGLQLLGKTEEERWAKAREDLGLSAYQEEELKAAIKEKSEGMREAFRAMGAAESSNADAGGNADFRILRPDVEKMREARRRYDDRVSAALTVDQQGKWRDDGYDRSLGGGAAGLSTFIRSDAGEAK